ncbi:MAG: hypothetical protein AAFP93_00345 [Bacteroidota bacterium]
MHITKFLVPRWVATTLIIPLLYACTGENELAQPYSPKLQVQNNSYQSLMGTAEAVSYPSDTLHEQPETIRQERITEREEAAMCSIREVVLHDSAWDELHGIPGLLGGSPDEDNDGEASAFDIKGDADAKVTKRGQILGSDISHQRDTKRLAATAAIRYGLKPQEIDRDGNCLFRAIADQLQKEPFNIQFSTSEDYLPHHPSHCRGARA